MKNLLALYFSGTGNTEYAVKQLCEYFSLRGVQCKASSIENTKYPETVAGEADTIMIAHPIYGSCMPKIMKEFLDANSRYFYNKNVITLVTQASFSGDGGLLAARMLKAQGIHHLASLHIKMPFNYAPRSEDDNKRKVLEAQVKIKKYVEDFLEGKEIKNGQGIFPHMIGSMQRITSTHYLEKLSKALKIDESLCVGCGNCVACCPMNNIEQKRSEKPVAKGNCTICYRCINLCPQKAIRLMSKKPIKVQYRMISD